MFGFDQRVSALEKELSQLKQADYSAQLLKTIKSQIPTMIDAQLSTRLKDSIKKSFRSYTTEFEKKAKDERKRYIDLVEKSVKDIIKVEVKSQLTQILPKEVSDYATPVIQSSVTESLENILDKDLFESYGNVYSLKRDREDKDKDKDEDPPAGSDQGLKKQKTSKDVEPSRGSKSKESNSSSSKGTKSQPKSSRKSAQAEELVFEAADTEMPLKQGDDVGNTDDQPNVEATPKVDWFKKPKRPPTLYSDWNTTKTVDFRPPQTWISKIAKAGKPLIFDELMRTPIDFSAYVLNNLKIENLTQEYLVGPAFNLLKVTCKIRVELEYHFEECYKAVTDRLDWTNPEGLEYPFDLSKPLPLIEDQGRQRRHGCIAMESSEGSLGQICYVGNHSLGRVVILKRVKDLQMGVESYQKKLNITRPETFRSDITKMIPYTAYNDPQGIIYQDKFQKNRLMCLDELYKFCDGTLSSVRKVLHDIASSLRWITCQKEDGVS
ncbi:hypothetical protein Tco_1165551 [Tanacetum coccineum]